MNGFVLAKKILRAGYFLMIIETDCIKYVEKCHQCQVHADIIRVLPNELNVTSSCWPFAAWGMDVISPVEPAASNGHIFILAAIDYFTKWVKTASYKPVTKKVISNFVRDRIVCRFGVPMSIITYNAANLNSDLM
nr:protein NYNRIN-like [Nicotiana tomentosiformis]XP_009611738.1 protein NYNRIN-like [Nicotiana tomentosiformis]